MSGLNCIFEWVCRQTYICLVTQTWFSLCSFLLVLARNMSMTVINSVWISLTLNIYSTYTKNKMLSIGNFLTADQSVEVNSSNIVRQVTWWFYFARCLLITLILFLNKPNRTYSLLEIPVWLMTEVIGYYRDEIYVQLLVVITEKVYITAKVGSVKLFFGMVAKLGTVKYLL